MGETQKLTIEILADAVKTGAAFRARIRLQPVGGEGDKVFPPTYTTDKGDKLKYATEERRVDGEDKATVLLDSVASQANRMEEALFEMWEDEQLTFPVLAVDFSKEPELGDLGVISALHAPHRYADALIRDGVDESGTPFRSTDVGAALTEASPRNATAVYRYCPTALVFGCWDSTGPKGGSGNKFQRCLVSEIIGVGMKAGVKVGSRLDPAGIQANVEVYAKKGEPGDWTIHSEEAEKKKGKVVSLGNPSAVNHSNIPPSKDTESGGVSFDYAQQTIVLSLAGLRRLRMATNYQAVALDPAKRKQATSSAQVALAALALAGVVAQRRRGYDLRSRCALVPAPAEPLRFEFLSADGEREGVFELTWEDARALLQAAAAQAADAGMGWVRQPLTLLPAPKLGELIRESRKRAAAGEVGESD